MKMRQVYLARDETISDAQTKTIDIDITDMISAIDVIYEATNGATSNVGQPLHKDVSAIELVDGAEILESLPMPHWLALNFYTAGLYPWHQLDEGASAVQKEKCTMFFGRWIGDPQLYFDPTRFRNPQLKLTHSLTISATAGFTSGTGKLTVIAHVFETKPPAARGFLMAKDIYSWTTAASGDETIDLPVDYPYRLLGIRAYESGTAYTTNVTKVKMSCDEDKFIPFDIYTDDLVTLNANLFGEAYITNKLLRADAATPETFLANPIKFSCEPLADLHIAHVEGITADTVELGVIVLTTTPTIAKQTSAQAIQFTASGYGAHNTYIMPFGRLDNPDTWFPSPDYKSIKLKVTQGDAGAAASIILQQLRKY